MSDFYTEQLVKRKTGLKTWMAKIGLFILTVVLIFFAFQTPLGVFGVAIVFFADYLLLKRMNVEFEYLYVNGELDVDKIMSREKRKRVFSTNISEMEIIAKRGYRELDSYQNLKVLDYTSQEPDHIVYEMIVVQKNQKIKVAFEPNETILDGMRIIAPRKVFI